MKTFELNGVVITAKEIDFNVFCAMSEDGASLEMIDKKPLLVLRSYIAYCLGVDGETAGKLINDHVVNGGGMENAFKAMGDAIEDSGFIQALMKATPEQPKAKATKTKSTKTKPTENVSE